MCGADGLNYFQMGLGRKIDPEPGRCRRTDGKKWRCSKEAYPDSKYCERHMHRGRNRSRKPVEIIQTPPKTTTTTTTSSTHHSLKIPNLAIPISPSSLSSLSNTHHHHLIVYPNSSSSRGLGLSFDQQVNTHLLLDSGPCSNPDKDYSRFVLFLYLFESWYICLDTILYCTHTCPIFTLALELEIFPIKSY